MSRRIFIKQSSLLAGGLLLHNKMVQAFGMPESNGIITVGIIGCGDRGRGLMNSFANIPDKFLVTSVCDVLDFRLEETRKDNKNPKMNFYKDYRKILDDKSIDAVVVAVPLHLHYDVALDVLQSGKHLYLEKTLTYNIPQAISLVNLAKKHTSQTIQVGHQFRYTPVYFKVKEMIEKGYLGKVTKFDCLWDFHRDWRRPVPEPSLERKINWRMYKEYSGGMTAELLSHQMDFINWAFDTHPDEITGSGGIDFYKDGREVFDNQQVIFRYNKDEMLGNFGITSANARDGYLFKLKGTKGTVSILLKDGFFYPEEQTRKEMGLVDGVSGATKLTWNKDGGTPILENSNVKDGTWYALNDFYKAITLKQPPSSTILTGARTAVCVHLTNKALYEKTIQQWKPEYNFV